MIVTADPLGDFNATSQILRYSALAREVTVPRIPSVTSTILAQSAASGRWSPPNRRGDGDRVRTSSDTERETMEIAALEIARMSEEIDGLRTELLLEQEARIEAEAHLESLADRMLELEAEVREDVYSEMEGKMQEEIRRWKAIWEEEKEGNEVHLDRKLEIYTRSIDAVGEGEDKENVAPSTTTNSKVGDMEEENERLRREVEQLRRELVTRSPTKASRKPLRENKMMGEQQQEPERSGSPQPKVRRSTRRGGAREETPQAEPKPRGRGNAKSDKTTRNQREESAVLEGEDGTTLIAEPETQPLSKKSMADLREDSTAAGRTPMLKLEKSMRDLRVSGQSDRVLRNSGESVRSQSPTKKARKLATRKWNWEEEEDF